MSKAPSTPAVRFLKEKGIAFKEFLYRYEDHGGTAVCARELNTGEHGIIKTLVMEDDTAKPLVVLMHGDREVSTKALARQIGAKTVHICKPDVANKHSGYQVGGTSPFGLKKAMPVYVEKSILALERVWINGGARGFLVEIASQDLGKAIPITPVEVALNE